jgi:hypothetical protein
LERGEPTADDGAEWPDAVLRLDEGSRISGASSGYMPGDILPLNMLYGASVYTMLPSKAMVFGGKHSAARGWKSYSMACDGKTL